MENWGWMAGLSKRFHLLFVFSLPFALRKEKTKQSSTKGNLEKNKSPCHIAYGNVQNRNNKHVFRSTDSHGGETLKLGSMIRG